MTAARTKVRVLNARQEAFCQSYARYGNATRAAKEAGYSEKTARAQGCRLLTDADILTRIEQVKSERLKALHMGVDETLAEIAKAARFSFDGILKIEDGAPYIDLEAATPDQLDVLTEATMSEDGKLKVKGPNKIAALGLIMRHHGLLKDKVEISVDASYADVFAQAQERARKARQSED